MVENRKRENGPAERAHPELPGFQRRWLGLLKNPHREQLFKRYEFCKRYVAGKAVLDVPCGVGWGTSLLANARLLFGLDLSEEAVSYGRAHYSRVRFTVGNMAELPFRSGSFQVVVCLEGLEHVPPEFALSFLDEVKRVTMSRGLLIVTCPILNDRGQSTGNPFHLKEYDTQELVEILNTRFQIIHLERYQGPDGPEIKSVCRVVN